MALGTYTDLQTSIISHAFRNGDVEFAMAVPDFIALAEERMNGVLRTIDMQNSVTLTADTNGLITLPADYLYFTRVRANTSPTRELELMTGDYAGYEFPVGTSIPQGFVIQGEQMLIVPGITPGSTLTLWYIAKIPPLSNTNPTNWVLAKAPSAYLYGALIAAAAFMMDDARAQTWGTLFEAAIEALNRISMIANYSNAVMRVRGPTP